MIHKIFEHGSDFRARVEYIFGVGPGAHDHKIENVQFLGGNRMLITDPIQRDSEGRFIAADVDPIIQQFEQVEELYQARTVEPPKAVFHAMLSIGEGEELTPKQWRRAVKKYMKALGYSDNQYVSVLHQDTDHPHCHVVANRIYRTKENRMRITRTSNERTVGMNVMRELEEEYGLDVVPSSTQTWDVSLDQSEYESAIAAKKLPWRMELVSRVGTAAQLAEGRTYTDFINECEAQGVTVNTRLDEAGKAVGVSYGFRGKAISGRKLKAARCTFQKLTSIGGIDCEEERDLPAIEAANERHKSTLAGDAKKGVTEPRRSTLAAYDSQETIYFGITMGQAAWLRARRRKMKKKGYKQMFGYRVILGIRVPANLSTSEAQTRYDGMQSRKPWEYVRAMMYLLACLFGRGVEHLESGVRDQDVDGELLIDEGINRMTLSPDALAGAEGIEAIVGEALRLTAQMGEPVNPHEAGYHIARTAIDAKDVHLFDAVQCLTAKTGDSKEIALDKLGLTISDWKDDITNPSHSI